MFFKNELVVMTKLNILQFYFSKLRNAEIAHFRHYFCTRMSLAFLPPVKEVSCVLISQQQTVAYLPFHLPWLQLETAPLYQELFN